MAVNNRSRLSPTLINPLSITALKGGRLNTPYKAWPRPLAVTIITDPYFTRKQWLIKRRTTSMRGNDVAFLRCEMWNLWFRSQILVLHLTMPKWSSFPHHRSCRSSSSPIPLDATSSLDQHLNVNSSTRATTNYGQHHRLRRYQRRGHQAALPTCDDLLLIYNTLC